MDDQKGIITSGSHRSYWMEHSHKEKFNQPTQNIKTEVVIVGGGIAGLTVAYCLCESGKKVVVVEDGLIGSGETGRTTAHLVVALDDRYYELERIFGKENAKRIADSHASAINLIEEIVKKENIHCDFKRVDGYLFLHPSDKPEHLQEEFEAAKEAGVLVSECKEVPGLKKDIKGLKFANQGQIHPMKYLRGLRKAIEEKGGEIFTGTHAEEINKDGIITKEGIHIDAQFIVVATNAPVNSQVILPLKQFPYRTYVVAAKCKKGSLPYSLWWDTGDFNANPNTPPYHYVRLQSLDEEHDLLICGGEDHATGLAEADNEKEEEKYAELEKWMHKYFVVGKTEYKWSGQVMEPMDALAYIGKNPMDDDNIFIVSGDSGNGMTHGTIAGILITDLINGNDNEWEKIYSPSRFKFLKTGAGYVKEFAQGYAAYLKLKPGDVHASKIAKLEPGDFASSAYKLQVAHPAGAPLYLMIGRVFAVFGGNDPKQAIIAINMLSAVVSALCIMFTFWIITHFAKKIIKTEADGKYSSANIIAIIGAGLVGSLACCYSDTFWFSAVEAEVYASSSFFTMLTFWAILKWENVADEPGADRWLILIGYIIGLAIGIHLLNLLVIPAVGYVYYFKKYKFSKWGLLKATLAVLGLLGTMQVMIIPLVPKLAAYSDLFFVNTIGLGFGSGVIFFSLVLIALIILGLRFTSKRNYALFNTLILAFTFTIIGYGSYAQVVIRAGTNVPINMNEPDDPFSFLFYINRGQYQEVPLIYGPYYNAKVVDYNYGAMQYRKDSFEYKEKGEKITQKFDDKNCTFFPRMTDTRETHVKFYKQWEHIKGERKPTFAENIDFFLTTNFHSSFRHCPAHHFAAR